MGSRIVSGGTDGIHVWDTSGGGGTLLDTAPARTGAVYSVAYSPASNRLASGGAEGVVRVWDVSSAGHLMARGKTAASTGDIYSVAYRPDGLRMASGGADGSVRVWDVSGPGNPVLVHTLPGRGRISSVVYSSDGRRLVSGGSDGLRVWEPGHGVDPIWQLGHDEVGEITSVAPNRTGTRILAAGDDHQIREWDVDRAQARVVLRGNRGRVSRVALGPEDGLAVRQRGRGRDRSGLDGRGRAAGGGSATRLRTGGGRDLRSRWSVARERGGRWRPPSVAMRVLRADRRSRGVRAISGRARADPGRAGSVPRRILSRSVTPSGACLASDPPNIVGSARVESVPLPWNRGEPWHAGIDARFSERVFVTASGRFRAQPPPSSYFWRWASSSEAWRARAAPSRPPRWGRRPTTPSQPPPGAPG